MIDSRRLLSTIISLIPFSRDEAFKIVGIGADDSAVTGALRDTFPRATLVNVDGSEPKLKTLDWWDVMFGADVVLAWMCLHRLNDAKKQYLYKAAAERLSARGALLIADLIDPQHPALHRLAADQWAAQAKAQADRLGAPELFQRFVDARWNHFRFPDAADQPSALFHQLMWLRHAGFASVDCCWLNAGHAVFGGFKQAAASGSPLRADS